MRNWEDLLKEKLEGYESPLPEGSLADFRARRDEAAPAAKRYSPRWGWALAGAAAVAAAGLAALLLPPRPAVPEDAVQIVHNQPVVEKVVPDSADIDEPAPVPLMQPANRKSTLNVPVARQETEIEIEATEPLGGEPTQEEVTESIEEAMEPTEEPVAPKVASPFIQQSAQSRPVRLKVAPVAGTIVGGGLLAAVVTPWARGGSQYPTNTASNTAATFDNLGPSMNGYVNFGNASGASSFDPYSTASGVPDSDKQESMAQEPATNVPQDVLSGNYTHYRPLKTGLSARIPLTEKLSVTTGLTYSLYCSRFTYSLSGEKAQQAHYLGIPIRLDWMLASNRWLDVYVGAGVAGDLCVGSALGGNAFAKDGPSFSVLGAGGLQWNMTPRIGLYVEPELSWTAPSDRHVLRTYRQEHPLVFTVATGLRINLGKQ